MQVYVQMHTHAQNKRKEKSVCKLGTRFTDYLKNDELDFKMAALIAKDKYE